MKGLNVFLASILGIVVVYLCVLYIFDKEPVLNVNDIRPVEFKFEIANKNWNYYKETFLNTKTVYVQNNMEYSGQGLKLPIELKGTYLCSPTKSFAIIKDIESGLENVYRLGEEVGKAKIVAMDRNKVVLEINGRKAELEVMDESGLKQKPTAVFCENKTQGNTFDFAKLLTQVRIKPYFAEGRCIGFQLSSINNGSLIHQIGLKEGDVVESINGVKVDDPLKAMQMIYSIQRNNPVHLGIDRSNEKIELDCAMEG